jgi:protein-tyrosine phosphatase
MFHILFVCTGNRCRSPIAEEHLRRLTADLPIDVGSVGLLDLGAAPVLPEVLEVGRAAGLDLARHRARHLKSIDLANIDLVIGLERSHVAAAVVEAAVPYERAFTLKELVRLLEHIETPDEADPIQHARAAVARAHELRGRDPSFVPGEDIEDPFGGPRSAYVDMVGEVAALCRALVGGLFGAPSMAEGRTRG